MRKDETTADLDVCFSDIWTAAQRSRSDFFRLFVVKTWRKMWRLMVPTRFGHAQPPAGGAHEEIGA